MTDSSAPSGHTTTSGTVVLIGASRGLGLAATREFLARGWAVVATARNPEETPLVDLALEYGALLRLERFDITREEDLDRLAAQVKELTPEVLYINAGIADADLPVGQVATEVFVDVMVTNALAPMRVVEKMAHSVAPSGVVAVVSSRQGSVSFNTRGGHEVYRASKAALNQLMRSYAARSEHGERTLVLLHPGWVKTDLGGPDAKLSVEESARGLVDVVTAHRSHELEFLDYAGQTVPW